MNSLFVCVFFFKWPFSTLVLQIIGATFSIATAKKKQLQSVTKSYKANPSTDYNVLNLGFPACLRPQHI